VELAGLIVSRIRRGMQQSDNFFDMYLEYTSKTEAPTFFHRWSILTCLGAYLGKQTYFHHGFFTLYPNLYTMLIGSPGTKKSSAIKISATLLKKAGYNTFAAKKTRQEKFLLDLADKHDTEESSMLEQNLFGEVEDSEAISECFVAADEFNNFIGIGNLDFMSILGELWDYEGTYDYKLKNSKSVYIPNPNISILGGNTPTGFSHAFPTEAIGQGFFSRLLLVYSDPGTTKFTFPPAPDLILQAELIAYLHAIKTQIVGEMDINAEAIELVDTIYHKWPGIDDVRFEHYANRRLTHLLKLCVVVAAAFLKNAVDVEVVIYANTILSYTEHLMPKALGEFGKARHSDVTHKLMTVLDATNAPLSLIDLWKHVSHDLENRSQLTEILGNLSQADKIQIHGDKFLPVKRVRSNNQIGVDFTLLREVRV
jgi:hypothetical protein